MQIASGISSVAHLVAFVTVAEQRYFDIDLSKILIYLVDNAPAEVLPYLADQFDVLGYKGWLFADTEEKRRALLKKAIVLHKKKGTPWAIREALKAIGYVDAEIIEGAGGITYDGTVNYDGTQDYGGGSSWANFIVRVTVDESLGDDEEIITNVVNAYKREACNLIAVELLYVS